MLKWFSRAITTNQRRSIYIAHNFHLRTHPTLSKEERNKLENPVVVFFQQLKPAKFTQRTGARVFIMGVKDFRRWPYHTRRLRRFWGRFGRFLKTLTSNISWPQSRICFAKRSTVTSIFSCKSENLDVFAVYMNVSILACISPSFHILHVHQLITITADWLINASTSESGQFVTVKNNLTLVFHSSVPLLTSISP